MSGTVQMWRVHLPSLKVGDRVRTDLGDIDGLVQSIRDRGLLQPLVLDEDGRILDGRNRYAACKIHGIAPEFVTYDADWHAVITANSEEEVAG